MQTTVDHTLEYEARRLICGILYYFDTKGHWPTSRNVTQLSGYKAATDKAAAMKFMIENGWLTTYEEANSHPKGIGLPRKFYVGTADAREAVRPPRALPELVTDAPVAFPDDPVEQRIYAFNLGFYRREGRWPNGEERARAFNGHRHKFSKERRARAVQNMIDDGELVHVTHRNSRGDTTFLIVPRISPEYADKNGWVFYAPNLAP